jgi:hypothetical protein
VASIGRTTALAFAGVHAFARVVGGLTAALALTFVHALAGVLWKGFFRVTHGLEGDARIVRRAHGVSLRGEAKDPVTSPATAAPAITALEGFIYIDFIV